MTRGNLAAGLAGTGVALAALAVVQGIFFALSGAYMLLVAPLIGLLIALGIYGSLHALCTTGAARERFEAFGQVFLLAALAVLGISFGGYPLLLPAALLAVATVLTPRPAPAAI